MLRKCMKHNWNYQRYGVGVLGNISLVGEVLFISIQNYIVKSKFTKCKTEKHLYDFILVDFIRNK